MEIDDKIVNVDNNYMDPQLCATIACDIYQQCSAVVCAVQCNAAVVCAVQYNFCVYSAVLCSAVAVCVVQCSASGLYGIYGTWIVYDQC